MSCLYDELPVVALDFGSLLVCAGFASRHLLVPPLQRVMRIWVRCNGGALRLLGIGCCPVSFAPSLILGFNVVPRTFAEFCVCGRSLNYDESSENGPLYPACLLNFEIRK